MKQQRRHLKNIQRSILFTEEIVSEAHLERIILKKWTTIFPFKHIATRKRITKRSIVDFIGWDGETLYIIELKFRPIQYKDLSQMRRYLKDIGAKNTCPIFIEYNHLNQNISLCLIKT